MALNLYRRHRRNCYGGHAEDSASSYLQERTKGWKRCDCDVHVSGTLDGRYARKTASTGDWDQARLVMERLERAGSWAAKPALAAPPAEPIVASAPSPTALPAAGLTPPVSKGRHTITDALQVFLAHKAASGIKVATLRTYRTFKERLAGFAAQRGYQMIDEVTATDIDVFWAEWTLGPRAKSNRLTTLRSFFRFCLHRKWIAESPVSPDIKPPVGASRPANKAPFTDVELDRILAACDGLHVNWKNEAGDWEWVGEDLKDLIWLMIHTGYRIIERATVSTSATLTSCRAAVFSATERPWNVKTSGRCGSSVGSKRLLRFGSLAPAAGRLTIRLTESRQHSERFARHATEAG